MVKQAQEEIRRHDDSAAGERPDVLHDGLGLRRMRAPAKGAAEAPGSPWALGPWQAFELARVFRDAVERFFPGRGNRAVIAAAGDDPQACLDAVMQACVIPALHDVRDQLVSEGYDVDLHHESTRAVVGTRGVNDREVTYTVAGSIYSKPVFSYAAAQSGARGGRYARIHIIRGRARRGASLRHCSRAAIRRDALRTLYTRMGY